MYTYGLILILIPCVGCSDEKGKNDTNIVSYSDSEEEADNFEVIQPVPIQPQPQPQPIPPPVTYTEYPYQQYQHHTPQYPYPTVQQPLEQSYQPHVPQEHIPPTQPQYYATPYQQYYPGYPPQPEPQPYDQYPGYTVYDPGYQPYQQLYQPEVQQYPQYYPGPIQPSHQYYVPPTYQPPQQPITETETQTQTQPYQPYVPQTTQEPSGYQPSQETTNTADGILGPAPGPLRHTRQILREYDKGLDKIYIAPSSEELKMEKPLELKLFKIDDEGNLVEMTPKEDYIIKFINVYKIKIELRSNLEKVIYKNEIVYMHIPGKPYCTELTKFKKYPVIILNREDGFLFANRCRKQWEIKFRNFPEYVKMYGEDAEGKEFQLNKGHYNLELTTKGSFEYKFIEGVMCTKVIVKEKLVWEKTEKEDHPRMLIITFKMNVVIHFKGYVSVFKYFAGKYRKMYSEASVEPLDE
eukprot:XP_763011.1 hypothetical protein [Theileria parva strain Muguga]